MTLPSSLRPKQNISQPQVQKPQQQFQQKPKQLPSSLKPKFQEFPEETAQNENDLERDIERSQARTTSRIGESIIGAPGDIASFFSGLFGKEQNVLPTSQSLKKFSEKATHGYTKAQTPFEEKIDEVSSDIGSMMLPGSGTYKLTRNIGIPVVANLVKEGLKYKDAGEKTQAYGKVGTMVALDLISRKKGGVKKYMDSLFQKSRESIPKGVSVNASKLEKSLMDLEIELSKGGKRPSTGKALEKMKELKGDIKKGKIDVSTLAEYRPAINEAIDELGGFASEVPFKHKPKAIRNLNQVKDNVIKTLSEYGEKFNPEFYKYHKASNEAYAAYAESNKIAKFLQDKVGFVPKSKAVQALFSIGPTAAAYGLSSLGPQAAIAGSAGALGYQGFKVLNRVMKSPVLRKYYGNVLKDAVGGNVGPTSRNLQALDKALEKEESEKPKGKTQNQ